MIEKDVPIKREMVVRHVDGLTYRVEGIGLSTVGYETAHELGGRMVFYTQLEDGSYPAGTNWCKDEEGFRQYFTPEPQAT